MSDENPHDIAPRQRDAARTRQRLLDAARHRFARHGCAATTVRDIADEAGVNVALINRYFGSKQGLLEATLNDAVQQVVGPLDQIRSLPEVVEAISQAAARVASGDGWSELLMLLLRPCEDQGAEQTRLQLLHDLSATVAATAGWHKDQSDGDDLLLRAQLVLAASAGIAMLYSSPGLKPLDSATEDQLLPPLHDLVTGVLAPKRG